MIGPSALGARLEGSKEFAKDFMTRHGIPTARYRVHKKERRGGVRVSGDPAGPYVLKADGLAAGKGVLIVPSLEEAKRELGEMLSGRFGHAGDTVVIEEYLSGIECSVFVATDGKSYRVLPVAKDYKRVGEGDTGPNTGGMGAVSPVPFADEAFMGEVVRTIVEPTRRGTAQGRDRLQGIHLHRSDERGRQALRDPSTMSAWAIPKPRSCFRVSSRT